MRRGEKGTKQNDYERVRDLEDTNLPGCCWVKAAQWTAVRVLLFLTTVGGTRPRSGEQVFSRMLTLVYNASRYAWALGQFPSSKCLLNLTSSWPIPQRPQSPSSMSCLIRGVIKFVGTCKTLFRVAVLAGMRTRRAISDPALLHLRRL